MNNNSLNLFSFEIVFRNVDLESKEIFNFGALSKDAYALSNKLALERMQELSNFLTERTKDTSKNILTFKKRNLAKVVTSQIISLVASCNSSVTSSIGNEIKSTFPQIFRLRNLCNEVFSEFLMRTDCPKLLEEMHKKLIWPPPQITPIFILQEFSKIGLAYQKESKEVDAAMSQELNKATFRLSQTNKNVITYIIVHGSKQDKKIEKVLLTEKITTKCFATLSAVYKEAFSKRNICIFDTTLKPKHRHKPLVLKKI